MYAKFFTGVFEFDDVWFIKIKLCFGMTLKSLLFE